MKDGEGINQGTFIYNTWTQKAIWVLAWGSKKVGLDGGGEREKKQEQV